MNITERGKQKIQESLELYKKTRARFEKAAYGIDYKIYEQTADEDIILLCLEITTREYAKSATFYEGMKKTDPNARTDQP